MEEILALVIVADDEAICMMPPEALHYAGQLEGESTCSRISRDKTSFVPSQECGNRVEPAETSPGSRQPLPPTHTGNRLAQYISLQTHAKSVTQTS